MFSNPHRSSSWRTAALVVSLGSAVACSPCAEKRDLTVSVKDAAFEEDCLHQIQVKGESEDEFRTISCVAKGADCVCTTEIEAEQTAVQLVAFRTEEVLVSSVVRTANDCGAAAKLEIDRDTYEFVRNEECEKSFARFLACGIPSEREDLDCVFEIDNTKDDPLPEVECFAHCATDASCETLVAHACSAGEVVTDYENCLGECLGLSESDLEDYGKNVGFQGLGGASGACD